MENVTCLISKLQGSRYAIDVRVVREIVCLPEVTPLAEAPPWIVGVINYRGKIVPVMDLNIRLGRPPHRYGPTNSVILLEKNNASSEGLLIGMILNEILDVIEISRDEVEEAPSYSCSGSGCSRIVTHIVKFKEHIVSLLNVENLIQGTDEWTSLSSEEPGAVGLSDRTFCPEATAEERAAFRERAANLMRTFENQDSAGFTPIAIVVLNGEFFGVRLDTVREFCDVHKVTPVPCCPDHIIGTMNLRGEIVTLVDIRGALKMPFRSQQKQGKAIVTKTDGLHVGTLVDEVYDVIYLNPSDVTAVPAARQVGSTEYLGGTALYGNKMVGLLDLEGILTKGGLTVKEEV